MSADPLTRTARLTVAYDGTGFHGFAESEGVRTVMGDLRHAIGLVVRSPVDLVGAGRTDAGVHAWGQVVSGLLPADTDLSRLVRSVNGLCGPDIAVRDARWVDDAFSARFSATARTYHYHVWNAPEPNPLLARAAWHVPRPLDIDTMNSAAAALLGEHDFSSFCRRPKAPDGASEPSLVRRLLLARWVPLDDSAWQDPPEDEREADRAEARLGRQLRFEVRATSFCHQMVRSIVGTLVDVGLGRRSATSIAATIAARDRAAAGPVAPATGLVLHAVDYRGERWDA